MTGEELAGGGTAVVPAEREFSDEDLALVGDVDALAPERSAISVDRELAAIAKLRRDDPRTYWRSEQTQARERELLATKDLDYPVARQAVQRIFDAIPAEERAGFDEKFDSLPRGAMDAIRAYLDIPPGGAARKAGDDDLKAFASTPAGANLVKKWKHHAPTKLGRLQQRLRLIEAAMTVEDAEAAQVFLNGLPEHQAESVLEELAG